MTIHVHTRSDDIIGGGGHWPTKAHGRIVVGWRWTETEGRAPIDWLSPYLTLSLSIACTLTASQLDRQIDIRYQAAKCY